MFEKFHLTWYLSWMGCMWLLYSNVHTSTYSTHVFTVINLTCFYLVDLSLCIDQCMGPFEIRYVLICMAPAGAEKWVCYSANFGTKSCESCDLVQNLSTFSVSDAQPEGAQTAFAVRLRSKWNRKIVKLGQNVHTSRRQGPYLWRGGSSVVL